MTEVIPWFLETYSEHKDLGETYDASLGNVESADIYMNERGMLDFMINIKYEGSSFQSFTGYALTVPKYENNVGNDFCALFLAQFFDFFGVSKTSQIKNIPVWVLKAKGNSWGTICGLVRTGWNKSKSSDGREDFLIMDLITDLMTKKED